MEISHWIHVNIRQSSFSWEGSWYTSQVIRRGCRRGFHSRTQLTSSPTLHPWIQTGIISPTRGLYRQETIDEFSSTIHNKNRMTHDKTFPGPTRKSVNLCLRKEDLPNYMVGHALWCMLHYIMDLRTRHLSVLILIRKWQCISSATARESLTCFLEMLYLAMQIPFDAAGCPTKWCCFSEHIGDLWNDLIQCKDWDHHEIYAPNQKFIPQPKKLPPEIPFKQAKEMAVVIPINDLGLVDMYINDMPPCTIDHLHTYTWRDVKFTYTAIHHGNMITKPKIMIVNKNHLGWLPVNLST